MLEVGNGLPLSTVEIQFDLMDQDIPTPSVLDRFPGIPESLIRVLDVIDRGGERCAPKAIVQQLVAQLPPPDMPPRNPSYI